MRFNPDHLDPRQSEDRDAEELDGLYGDSPPVMPEDVDSLASYTQKKHNIVNVKTLVNPVPKPNESIGQSAFFTATPAVVHFGGLVVGKVHEQTGPLDAAGRVLGTCKPFGTSFDLRCTVCKKTDKESMI